MEEVKMEEWVPVVSPPAPASAGHPPSAAAAELTAPPSAERDLHAEPHHPETHNTHAKTHHNQQLTPQSSYRPQIPLC